MAREFPAGLWHRYVLLMAIDRANFGEVVPLSALCQNALPDEAISIRQSVKILCDANILQETGDNLFELTPEGAEHWNVVLGRE